MVKNSLSCALGNFLLWCERVKDEKKRKNPGKPKKILWSGVETEEVKDSGEQIFRAPDRIIWDIDEQEYYYLLGKNLLRLRADGTFMGLTA